jgi:hypothetical protein
MVTWLPLLSQVKDTSKTGKGCAPVSYLGKYSGKAQVSRSEWNSFDPKSLLVKENCEGGVPYTILEYHFTCKVKGIPTTYLGKGSEIYSQMRDVMKRDRVSRIVFDEIKAKGPDGRMHNVPPIILIIN